MYNTIDDLEIRGMEIIISNPNEKDLEDMDRYDKAAYAIALGDEMVKKLVSSEFKDCDYISAYDQAINSDLYNNEYNYSSEELIDLVQDFELDQPEMYREILNYERDGSDGVIDMYHTIMNCNHPNSYMIDKLIEDVSVINSGLSYDEWASGDMLKSVIVAKYTDEVLNDYNTKKYSNQIQEEPDEEFLDKLDDLNGDAWRYAEQYNIFQSREEDIER